MSLPHDLHEVLEWHQGSDLKLSNGIHTLAALLVSGTALVKVGAFQHTVFMFKQCCSKPEVLSAPIGSCGNSLSELLWELETLFKTKYRKAMLPPASGVHLCQH